MPEAALLGVGLVVGDDDGVWLGVEEGVVVGEALGVVLGETVGEVVGLDVGELLDGGKVLHQHHNGLQPLGEVMGAWAIDTVDGYAQTKTSLKPFAFLFTILLKKSVLGGSCFVPTHCDAAIASPLYVLPQIGIAWVCSPNVDNANGMK